MVGWRETTQRRKAASSQSPSLDGRHEADNVEPVSGSSEEGQTEDETVRGSRRRLAHGLTGGEFRQHGAASDSVVN